METYSIVRNELNPIDIAIRRTATSDENGHAYFISGILGMLDSRNVGVLRPLYFTIILVGTAAQLINPINIHITDMEMQPSTCLKTYAWCPGSLCAYIESEPRYN
jgi:hypothetical protein